MDVRRYAEVIGDHRSAVDVLTGNAVDLTQDIALKGRDALILEF
jgi:plasmid maintenance system antidote protein VapI